jgi:hypothetical protein
MNKPRIARLTEEIALVINSYEFIKELELSWVKFIEGVNHFDNMVNCAIPLSIPPLSKEIPMNPMNKVKSSNIRRGNNIVFPVSCG